MFNTSASGNKCFFSPSSSSSWCLPLESACDAAVGVPNTTSASGTNAHSAPHLTPTSLARHAVWQATQHPQGSLVTTSFAAHQRAETWDAWRISTKHIRLSYSANRSVAQLEQDTWASESLTGDGVDKATYHEQQVSRKAAMLG